LIQLQADVSQARDYLKRLEKRDMPRVIGRSLDRTGKSGRTFLSRRLRERVALSKTTVDRAISIRRSGEVSSLAALNAGRAWFELRVSGDPIPLRDFKARSTRRGVTYQVSHRVGRKQYLSREQPAFVVARFGGHVFVRKSPEPPGPAKAGIRKVYGPSLPQFFRTRRQREALIQHCTTFWASEVTRNARYVLQRRGIGG
jgi:hypothetical protein